MSLEINGSWMGQVEINGVERHRIEVNGSLVYAKRPLAFDTNLDSYTLPAGYSASASFTPEGAYYFFWKDYVWTYRSSGWTRHQNSDNTTWIGTPSISVSVSDTSKYWMRASFLGWYTDPNDGYGIQITNSDGDLTNNGISFMNNSNNYPTRSSSSGMDTLYLYAHWQFELQLKVTMSTYSSSYESYTSSITYNFDGGSYENSSVGIWINYGDSIWAALNQITNLKYRGAVEKYRGVDIGLGWIGYTYNYSNQTEDNLISTSSLPIYSPVTVYPQFLGATLYWDTTGKHFTGTAWRSWGTDTYSYPVSQLQISIWANNQSDFKDWSSDDISSPLYLHEQKALRIV